MPAIVAARQEQRRAEAVAQALRRLRRGKPPFPIHRPRARLSSFQHALAHEAVMRAAGGSAASWGQV